MAKEYWEISREEYERRFAQRWTPAAEKNVLGYGPGKKYAPPLFKPTLAVTHIERNNDLIFTGGPLFWWFAIIGYIVWDGALNGETWDMFWYNNAMAVGTQSYPTSIYKYYDFFSLGGFFVYSFDWAWALFCVFISPLTLFIPLNIWIILFTYSWDGIWKVFIPAYFGHFFGIEIENGWIMG